jgi:hypothetical protein
MFAAGALDAHDGFSRAAWVVCFGWVQGHVGKGPSNQSVLLRPAIPVLAVYSFYVVLKRLRMTLRLTNQSTTDNSGHRQTTPFCADTDSCVSCLQSLPG